MDETTRATLKTGWDTFACDLVEQPDYRSESHGAYQQAYRNGAAAILARGAVQGSTALTKYFSSIAKGPHIDDELALQEIILPAWAISQTAHPEWSELHRDACISGGLAALVMLFCGLTLTEITTELLRF
jgi:hypothetical protein